MSNNTMTINTKMNKNVVFLTVALALLLTGCNSMRKPVHISCQTDNDLVQILQNQNSLNVILH
ncbi:MAG: hypothetical protein JW915_23260, partial [Chitinispirillaceae bacterium]|nr:hypothetical protein [Chitinispirillaceae bacterium]